MGKGNRGDARLAEKMIIVSVKSRDISVFDIKSNLFKVCYKP